MFLRLCAFRVRCRRLGFSKCLKDDLSWLRPIDVKFDSTFETLKDKIEDKNTILNQIKVNENDLIDNKMNCSRNDTPAVDEQSPKFEE